MSRALTLFVGERAWRIVLAEGRSLRLLRPRFEPAASPAQRAEAAAELLKAEGLADETLTLALGSRACLCARITTTNLPRAGRRRLMDYRLEERLPAAAEDFVADYLSAGRGEALGVCTDLAALGELTAALEAAGLRVVGASPAALLAGSTLLAEAEPQRRRSIRAAAIEGPEGCDLLLFHRGAPVDWRWHGELQQALAEYESTREAGSADANEAGGEAGEAGACDAGAAGDSADGELLRLVAAAGADDQPSDYEACAARAVLRVREGQETPWIDLRPGSPGGGQAGARQARSTAALIAAAALLLLSLIALTQWRARQYGRLYEQARAAQSEVFRRTLPGQRMTGAPVKRLKSELIRLTGPRGHAARANGAAAGDVAASGTGASAPDALAQLRDVLERLPAEQRFRLNDLFIQPDLVRLEGEARNHAEAEALAVALGEDHRYAVDPPRTQALRGGGVSFVFTARPAPPAPPAPPALPATPATPATPEKEASR